MIFEGIELREDPKRPGYWISAGGAVLGRRGHWLKIQYTRKGYAIYGGRPTRALHVAVAEAWLPERPGPEYQVCHIDGDPANNSVGNLRWGTQSDNERDKIRHGRHSQLIKTKCPAGHAYDDDNTYRPSRRENERQCRKCRAASERDRYRRRRDERS